MYEPLARLYCKAATYLDDLEFDCVDPKYCKVCQTNEACLLPKRLQVLN